MSEPFKGGQATTLFPMMTNGLEDRATCIFFAVLELVYPFRNELLKSVGQKAYKAGGDFNCLLRPSIGGRLSDKDIPDALISLDQKTKWKALVEVKIGSKDLDQAQLGRYLNRAISEKVDALITISNEMCSDPEHPPLRLKPAEKRLRKIAHYHWSWRYVKYQAELVLQNDDLDFVETKILEQFVAFLAHDKSGIHGFNQMPKCWPDFVDVLRDGYIKIVVDINGRCIKFETAHMPTSKVKTPYKQIERFLDTFRDEDTEDEWGGHSDVRLFGKWSRYKDMTDSTMWEAMVDAKEDTLRDSKLIHPKSENLSQIIVQYTPSGAAKTIRSRKKMIEFLEEQIQFFAETYVQA